MIPPALKAIAEDAVRRFVELISDDIDRSVVPDLLAAEEMVVEFARELGREMLQNVVEVRKQQAKATRPPCSCGKRPEVLNKTPWTRETPLGPITVEDFYTYCRTCHESARPMHGWLGVDREVWSLDVQEAAVNLAADEACQKAVVKLGRMWPGVEMGRTTALRLLHRHGEQARAFIDEKLGQALPSADMEELPTGGAPELEVEFDGGMIPVGTLHPIELEDGQKPELTPVRKLKKRRKDCRWEEAKVGLVQVLGDDTRLYSLRPTDELDEAFDDLLALAYMKGLAKDTHVRGVADGARHIRPRMEDTFAAFPFRFILDRPHCKEHLSDAGTALEPLTGLPAQQWAGEALATMEAGRAVEVVAELQAAYDASKVDELRLEANYFERNQDAVAYQEYRAHGWSTASSEIESAHGHAVQSRMKISGAWWHPDNVPNVLALRMLKANGWWDDYWTERRQEWRRRAALFAEAIHRRAA